MTFWQHAVVSDVPVPAVYVELKDGSNLFPLYLYPNAKEKNLLESNPWSLGQAGRRPNLNPAFVVELEKQLGMRFVPDGKGDRKKTFGPEDILAYTYAVFHSPTYRRRYAEFLKIDFPRLPLTSDPELFRKLCVLGEELVALHLMEKHGPKLVSYPVKGDNAVEKVRYTSHPDPPPQGGREKAGFPPRQGGRETKGRVWINKTQYFEGVPPEIWNCHIGGYQVCEKWLKDRKGRKLSYEELTHYQHIVSALAETIRWMGEIDAAIEQHGGWPMK